MTAFIIRIALALVATFFNVYLDTMLHVATPTIGLIAASARLCAVPAAGSAGGHDHHLTGFDERAATRNGYLACSRGAPLVFICVNSA